MNQQEVANILGIDRSTVSNWENISNTKTCNPYDLRISISKAAQEEMLRSLKKA